MSDWEEVKTGGKAIRIEEGQVIEGILENIREDVGVNKSNIYTINGHEYWGASHLDQLMQNVSIGSLVKIEITNPNYKFPNGRTGRFFKVLTKKANNVN